MRLSLMPRRLKPLLHGAVFKFNLRLFVHHTKRFLFAYALDWCKTPPLLQRCNCNMVSLSLLKAAFHIQRFERAVAATK